jgi:hypothetical protein
LAARPPRGIAVDGGLAASLTATGGSLIRRWRRDADPEPTNERGKVAEPAT